MDKFYRKNRKNLKNPIRAKHFLEDFAIVINLFEDTRKTEVFGRWSIKPLKEIFELKKEVSIPPNLKRIGYPKNTIYMKTDDDNILKEVYADDFKIIKVFEIKDGEDIELFRRAKDNETKEAIIKMRENNQKVIDYHKERIEKGGKAISLTRQSEQKRILDFLIGLSIYLKGSKGIVVKRLEQKIEVLKRELKKWQKKKQKSK